MATITIRKTVEAADGNRLVNALEDAGIDILHRCGGKAKCTTCRVTFNSGEPEAYNRYEKEKLESGDNLGAFRLSCQILCHGEMDVNVLMRLSEMENMDDAGPRVADTIEESMADD